jgi:hypothetical protein
MLLETDRTSLNNIHRVALQTTPKVSRNKARGCPIPRGLPRVASHLTHHFRAQRGERSECIGFQRQILRLRGKNVIHPTNTKPFRISLNAYSLRLYSAFRVPRSAFEKPYRKFFRQKDLWLNQGVKTWKAEGRMKNAEIRSGSGWKEFVSIGAPHFGIANSNIRASIWWRAWEANSRKGFVFIVPPFPPFPPVQFPRHPRSVLKVSQSV